MSVGPSSPDESNDKPFRQARDTPEESERSPRGALDETETARPAATHFPTHVTIEGYQIIRELHRGGQGIVYEAVQKSTRRKVAIKVLLEGRFASSAARRRFQREITLAAGLKHPNIIAIFDSGETPDGHQFCVMDYVRGRSIRDYVRENKLPLEDTLKLFSLVCEAAHFANQRGVIHRDLKPSNILVDTDGVPRVLDFGLAKQLAGGEQTLVSMTGQVMGTLQYMSPEQTRGNPDEIDARSDVYSLGVVLYELLTGQHPYPVKGEVYEVVKHIMETEPTPPSKVWTADSGVSRRKSGRFRIGQCPIDDELQTILFKSLAKNRERRYQSAEALRQDVSNYLQGKPIEAKRDSSLYVLKKSLRRHRTPIAVMVGFVVVAAVALNVGSRTERAAGLDSLGPITSLAVLPLENLSGDPEQEYFSDGMTGELITALGKIKALKVISRMSVMRYKNTDKSPPQIARELGVDALVEGTVTRFGNRVRIVANLIRASTSEQLWGDSYERDLRDILAMQGEIARAIAEEIQVRLTPQEQAVLTDARPVNPQAQKALLKGTYHLQKWTKAGYEKAIDYFEQALTIDPAYAAAYAALGQCYSDLAFFGHLAPKDAYPRAKELIAKALELDDRCATAHLALAMTAFYYDWDWAKAERGYQRAIELDRSDAWPRVCYAWHLIAMSRFDEALTQAKRAQELDPLSREPNLAVGEVFYYSRKYDDAMRQFRKNSELDPNDPWAHRFLALLHERNGMYDQAALEHAEDMRHSGRALVDIAAYRQAYAAGGWEGALKWTIDNLETQAGREPGPPPSLSLATAYAKLGEKDKAFEWLEKACEWRNSGLPFLAVDPDFDPLRDDPRFDDLLRRIGLKPSRAAGFSPRGDATDKALAGDGKIMLAVLPFENLSADPEQEYFSDGMTEEMIAKLGRMQPETLRVIARTSAMRYKNTNKPLAQIARELGVQYILEGSVRRANDRVRITTALIQVSDQTQLWGDTYDRDLIDVFTIQSDVAGRVAEALAVKLLPAKKRALDREPTTSSVAHDAYLKGLYHWNKRTELSLKRSVQFFETAVESDPDFALAHAGLALSHVVLAGHGYLPPAVAMTRVKEEAEKAIALDETLGEAHLALALYISYEWNHRAADGEFREAIRLNPAHPTTHQWYAEFLVGQGRVEEALAQIEQAQQLDPASRIINAVVGMIYYRAHRFDEAVEQTLRALDFDPNFPFAHFVLGRCYAEIGLFEEAVAEVSQAIALGERSIEYVAALGYAYARAGRPDEAKEILDELNQRSQTQYVSAYNTARVYAGLGDVDEAFRLLDRAYDERDFEVGWILRVDPSFKSLHGDPRFDDLLRRMNFEPTRPADSRLADSRAEDSRAAGKMKSRFIGSPRGDAADELPAGDGKIMLAVLPFENLGSPDDEYFADGISDEIRSRLAAVRKLGVISRSSAFQYKDTNKPNRQIGAELGVDYLIDGTIRWDKRAGGAGRVRITPELIRVSDDMSIWSQPYNRVLEDIFEVQSDIARQVIKQLKITLLEPERQAIEAKPTENSDAYHAYLRGLDYAGRPDSSKEDLSFAVQMFKRAVSIDPSFALAYAQLSVVHSTMHHEGYDRTEARVAKAKSAVERALELQPDLPETHLSLGYYHYYCYREYGRALEALAIAEKGLPNDARILLGVGAIRRRQGRLAEALDNMKRASVLSPIDANLAHNIAQNYSMLRRYPDAERWCDRSISMAPNQVVAYERKALIHWLWHGDIEKARATLEDMPRINTPRSIFYWFQQELFERKYQTALDRLAFRPGESLAYQFWFIPKSQLAGLVHQLMGESQRSREAYDTARIMLEEQIRKRPDDHRVRSSLGIVYAGLGRKEDAIREGKRGVELFPVSKDALIGPYRVEDLAFIYTLVGDYDAALDRLEYLLSIPSETMSVPMLRLDPRWDPLRDHPRYKALLRRHGFDPDSKPQATEPRDAKPPDEPADSGG